MFNWLKNLFTEKPKDELIQVLELAYQQGKLSAVKADLYTGIEYRLSVSNMTVTARRTSFLTFDVLINGEYIGKDYLGPQIMLLCQQVIIDEARQKLIHNRIKSEKQISIIKKELETQS